MQWSEVSCILKSSLVGGIGVFATHDIPAGTEIFTAPFVIRKLKIAEVPDEFRKFCVYVNDTEYLCPERFDRLEIGWYINHSATPNIYQKDTEVNLEGLDLGLKKRSFYSLKDIKAGDEITIDYNYLNEPEHLKDSYYKP